MLGLHQGVDGLCAADMLRVLDGIIIMIMPQVGTFFVCVGGRLVCSLGPAETLCCPPTQGGPPLNLRVWHGSLMAWVGWAAAVAQTCQPRHGLESSTCWFLSLKPGKWSWAHSSSSMQYVKLGKLLLWCELWALCALINTRLQVLLIEHMWIGCHWSKASNVSQQ